MNRYPGKLIVLYGVNNLGKSTQARLLVERLKANGYQSEYLKYAIYSLEPSGPILDEYLRAGNPYGLSPREAQIIQVINRTQYQNELIAKLKAGINVIAEDYKGTGIAWGLGAGVDEKFLKQLNSHLIDEDLVFLFDGERFRRAVESNHKHETDDELTNKVRWAHLKLREEYGWFKVDANLPIDTIHEQIWSEVKALLEGAMPEKDEQPRQTYNYSGFQPIKQIITETPAAAFVMELAQPKEDPKNEQKETTVSSPLPRLKVERLTTQAKLPQRGHAEDAGLDVYSSDYYSIPPYGQALVSTGLRLAIPEGFAGLIWDKSGLALSGIKTMGGVIDSNYRGELKVIVKNLSEEIYNIVPGQKVAQILIQPVAAPDVIEEEIKDETSRQAAGFGSTGRF